MQLPSLVRHFLIFLGAVLPVLALMLYLRRKRRKEEEPDVEGEILWRILEPAQQALEANIEMLEKGDTGWRPLAKGESSIGLSLVVPQTDEERLDRFARLEMDFPAVAEAMREHDRTVRRLRRAAGRLADRLEAPVKRQFERDRERFTADRALARKYRQLLVGGEDAWMFLLRGIVTKGRFAERLRGYYGEYWAERGAIYLRIMDTHGGAEREHFEDLKVELRNLSIDLKGSLRKAALRIETARGVRS